MHFCKHRLATLLWLSGLLPLSASGAAPESVYPQRPITIVAGYPPGAGLDTLARLLAKHLSSAIGQTVVIEYRPGAASNLAAESVAQFAQLPTVLPHIKAGSLRAIAVISPRRLPMVHNIPTIEECGLPGLQVESWYGLMAPTGTPPAVIEKLNSSINTMLMTPELQASFMDLAYVPPLRPNTPNVLRDLISREAETWTNIIRQRNIQPAQ